MQKRQHDRKIHMATYRARLAPINEPYWRGLGKGCALGFRKLAPAGEAGGNWVARWMLDEKQANGRRPKTVQRFLGPCQTSAAKQQPEELTFEEAERAAQAWFAQCRGGVVRAGTVENACRQYVSNQRVEKGEQAAHASELILKRHVYEKPFGDIDLDKLTTRDIEKLRDGMVTKERRKSTVNRDMRSIKAALNFAFRQNLCPTDVAWRRVSKLKGEGASDNARTVSLTHEQRQRLLAECDNDLADLLRGLLHTAGRPFIASELPPAKVADFDRKRKTLRLRNFKGDGTERVREVPLSDQAVRFFEEKAKGKLPSAYLFTYEGYPWARDVWSNGIKTAVKAANEKITDPADKIPADTCAYTMRHCAITDRLTAGINVSSVAKMAGTSVAMIEKYYFKYIPTDVREQLSTIIAF